MADDVDLQRLIVSFEANQKQFNSQLDKIDRKLANTTRGMERGMGRAAKSSAMLAGSFKALVPAVTVAGLLRMGRNALDAADKIDKLAISTGLSRERIQTLSFAADQLGVGAETAAAGFERFGRRLGEFKNTGAGPAAQALEQLGLANDVLTGALPNTEAALDAVITALDGVENSQQQAALAAKLFGDEVGPKFARLLASGADGLRKLEDQARSLGLVMSDELIAKSVEARDKIDALSAMIETRATIAFAELAPAISDAADAIFEFIEASTQARNDFGAFIDDVVGGNETLRDSINGIREALKNNPFVGPTIRFLTNPVNDPNAIGSSQGSEQFGPFQPSAGGATPEAIEKYTKATQGSATATKEQRDVLGELNAELERQIRNLEFEASLIGKTEAEVSHLTAAYEKQIALEDALLELAEAGIALSPQQVDALKSRLDAVEDLTVGLEAQERAEEAAKDAAEDAKRAAEEVARAQYDVANGALNAAEAIAAAAKGTQSWEEALIQLLRIFLQLQQSGALDKLAGGFGGGGFGSTGGSLNTGIGGSSSSGAGFFDTAASFVGGLFGGFRAAGGPVQSGRAYAVGENGPELFMPSVPGRIVSANQTRTMQSAPSSIPVTVNIQAQDVESFRRSQSSVGAGLRRAIQQAQRGA